MSAFSHAHPEELDDRTLALAMALEQAGPVARRTCAALGGPRAAPYPRREGSAGPDCGPGQGDRPCPGGGPPADPERELTPQEQWERLTPRLLERLAFSDPARERQRMDDAGVGLILWGDPAYPPLLACATDPPVALWVRGNPAALHAPGLSIVGARRATSYGITQAARFSEHLAEAGWMIASGAARGVDAQAHRGALRAGGSTVAIVGGGLADPYPPEHLRLLEAIVEAGGAVASESPMETPATPDRFPARNRIIAGLTALTLVIEAARDSGAMITARLALELGHREVCALPGPVHSPLSAGCHEIIRTYGGALVESPEEVDALLRRENALLEVRCTGTQLDAAAMRRQRQRPQGPCASTPERSGQLRPIE
jgi:DNA protecting protein DprA